MLNLGYCVVICLCIFLRSSVCVCVCGCVHELNACMQDEQAFVCMCVCTMQELREVKPTSSPFVSINSSLKP